MNKNKNRKFVSVIWGYSENMHSFSAEENYHLHILKVAKTCGYEPYVIIRGSKKNIEENPNFDKDIKVIDYNNFFYFIFNIIRFSLQKSIFYVNSYEWQSFLIPFLARKTIFMGHSQPKRKTKNKQIIQNFVFKFFTAIRLNNKDERQFLIEQGTPINKLFVIPLVVSQNVFKLSNTPERKDIVFLGNVTPTKNLEVILKALKIVSSEKADIKLNIIGNIYDNNFISKIKELELSNNVILHGYIPQNEKLMELLNSTLISANSSISEGQCVAVYDTALCGCVLCLPNIMSFTGVFKDKALFHEVNDYEQLAKNILFYLNNPDTIIEYRRENIEMIVNNYSERIIENKLKDLILKI